MPKWCLIQITDANSVSEAGQLIGRKVILKCEKNEFIRRIVDSHGGKKGHCQSQVPQSSTQPSYWNNR
jgi:ribosomal protein L35AE/L33A